MATKRNTVVVVDNVDIDNPLAALAACSPDLQLNVKAVIVTGRPAHPDREADITEYDPSYSEAILRLNAKRMKGVLKRAGYNVPVFSGLIPPKTLVPHSVHIDEGLLDLHGDERDIKIDGTFDQAVEHLCDTQGRVNFIVGGPLTELAAIMREPRLNGRLNTVTCQLGLFGFGNVATMAGGGLTFNSAADPDATRAVLTEWPGNVFMVPTDVTKSPDLGFDSPAQLAAIGVNNEIVRLYEIFWREALEPRGERIYPHDVHAALLMAQLHQTYGFPYGWKEVRIDSVGKRGEVDAEFGFFMNHPGRYVVKRADADIFMSLLRQISR